MEMQTYYFWLGADAEREHLTDLIAYVNARMDEVLKDLWSL